MRPFHDLHAGFRAQEQALLDAVRRVLDGGHYILGPEVAAFEAEFAAWVGARRAVGVGSATEGLQVALLALDVRPGDEVVVPALTAAPTVMAVLAVGAVPVLADVDADTYVMDPASLRAALSPRTRVVIPVHLYGQCADMDALAEVLEGRGVAVLEDCAQAHGATDHGRRAGTLGALAVFSFYPTKNLGAFGDAGAITAGDAALAERCLRLRNYGAVEDYDFAEPGLNARLDELQAALLRVRLRAVDANNAARARHAERYLRALRRAPLTLPAVRPGAGHVWHQFVVRCGSGAERAALAAHLAAAGLRTLVHYARPLHRMAALQGRARWVEAPVRAERAAERILSLPIYPEMSAQHQDEVIAAVDAWRP